MSDVSLATSSLTGTCGQTFPSYDRRERRWLIRTCARNIHGPEKRHLSEYALESKRRCGQSAREASRTARKRARPLRPPIIAWSPASKQSGTSPEKHLRFDAITVEPSKWFHDGSFTRQSYGQNIIAASQVEEVLFRGRRSMSLDEIAEETGMEVGKVRYLIGRLAHLERLVDWVDGGKVRHRFWRDGYHWPAPELKTTYHRRP